MSEQKSIQEKIIVQAMKNEVFRQRLLSPRDAQRAALSTEVPSQACSVLALLSGKGTERPSPYGNRRATTDSQKLLH
jgi:hypothetical protein